LLIILLLGKVISNQKIIHLIILITVIVYNIGYKSIS